ELLLDGQVPLVDHCGFEVLVKDANAHASVAGLVDSTRALRVGRRPKAVLQAADATCRRLLQDPEWKVLRQFLVATAAFHEARYSEARTDNGFAVEGSGRPGHTDAWQEIA